MPIEVRRAVGYALFAAQQGEKHDDAKVLKGFGDAGVLEVIARHDGDTFRAVYTVRFGDVVYVLHVFRKKVEAGHRYAEEGAGTDPQAVEAGREDHKQWSAREGQA